MPQVLMNFQQNDGWWVHFIEADCRTTIGRNTRFFRFDTLPELREFVIRCHPPGANLEEFDNNVRSWARGSIYVNLDTAQYEILKQPGRASATSKNNRKRASREHDNSPDR